MTLKGDAIFKEKLISNLKNGPWNLINFHSSSRKHASMHFDRFVLFEAYEDLDEKLQKSYAS